MEKYFDIVCNCAFSEEEIETLSKSKIRATIITPNGEFKKLTPYEEDLFIKDFFKQNYSVAEA